jgi:hypothetical protein
MKKCANSCKDATQIGHIDEIGKCDKCGYPVCLNCGRAIRKSSKIIFIHRPEFCCWDGSWRRNEDKED